MGHEERFKNGHRRKRNNNHTNQRQEPTIKTESLNYFFNAECTDSEDEDPNHRKPNYSQIGIPQYDQLVRMKL